ncbi:Tether containing UBX domain for GLUT4 [Phlyctochytrium planicorne]|nr:Tether containing UBX domain for GLUT4 [Phlyctochytrium planicorne]
MASNITIELEGEPLKKVSLKTTPAMSLKSLVDEACTKLKLPVPDSFGLKYQRNMLDLSLSVRFANLPAGAKLFLVKGRAVSPGAIPGARVPEVDIALQVEDIGRYVGKFKVSATLWEILKFFENRETVNLTKKTIAQPKNGPLGIGKTQSDLYLIPVIVLMNKEFATIEALKSSTLRDAGLLTGNAVLRVLFRASEKTLDEMLPVITQEVKIEDIVAAPKKNPAVDPAVSSSTPNPAVSANIPASAPSTIPGSTILEISRVSNQTHPQAPDNDDGPMDRAIKVFGPSQNDRGSQSIELPDSFFELTPNEVKMMLHSQKSRAKALEDAPLMTKAMRDREEQLRKSKYPKTMIRVKFPDRLILQATFLSDETIGNLYKLVQTSLRSPQKFTLYTSPPLVNLKDSKQSMWDAKLAPASLVYVRWEDADLVSAPYLSDELVAKMEEIPLVKIDVQKFEVGPSIADEDGDTKMEEVTVHAVPKTVQYPEIMPFLANKLRDRIARFIIAEKEPERLALRLVVNDKEVPMMTRLKAQMELQKFPRYARPNAVHNRCVESGKTRGYISAFKLSKIVFREKALAGELPGVRKSTWG